MILSMLFLMMGGQQGQQGNPIALLMPLVLIFIIMYFFMIRPQAKRQKQHQQMVQSLTKGERVVTTGGIRGKIVGVKDDYFVIQTADNTKLEILKSAIAKREKEQ